MYEAIVIGGGIVGLSTAYHLVVHGARTLLLDRADQGQATQAGAGIVSPETYSAAPEAWFDLAIPAAQYYPRLIDQLIEEQSNDPGYSVCGKLVVAVSNDEIELFEESKQYIFEQMSARNWPSADNLEEISSANAQRLFPPLAEVYGAVYSHIGIRVDGRKLALALRAAAIQRGLEILKANVVQLQAGKRSVMVVTSSNEQFQAVSGVIAGGAWSPEISKKIGVSIPVEPQRGQIAHLSITSDDTESWPVVSSFRGHYIVPWPANRIVVGATRESGSGFHPVTSVIGVREILDEATRVAPGLKNAELRELRVGIRPMSSDGLPILGKSPSHENVYLATGHGSTGLTTGPYSGRLIAELILGKAPAINLSPYSLARFSTA